MADPTATQIGKSVLIAVLSRGLSIGAFWLVSKGIVAPEILTTGNVTIIAVGLAGFAIDLGWILFSKIRTWYLVEAARKAAPGEKMSVIKAEAVSNSPV